MKPYFYITAACFYAALVACQPAYDVNPLNPTNAVHQPPPATSPEFKLFAEYRDILEQTTGSVQLERQKLTSLLSHFPEQNRSMTLRRLKVDILLRLGEFEAAFYQLQAMNHAQDNASDKKFECFLMEVIQFSRTEIQQCYLDSAKRYQALIHSPQITHALIKQHAVKTPYAPLLWSYYVSLYHSGDASALKPLLSFVQHEPQSHTYFKNQLLLETDLRQRTEFLWHFRQQSQTSLHPHQAYRFL